MVTKSTATVLALPLAASLLLAGCGGGDPRPDARSSTTARTSSTTSPTPTTGAPSTSPTTSAPAVDPDIPAAARAHTAAGAEAFARYFFAQTNAAWTKPQTGLIPPLGLATCKTCVDWEATATDLVAEKQRYPGPVLTTQYLGAGGELPTGEQSVNVLFRQEPVPLVDLSGRTVETTPLKSGTGTLLLVWRDPAWSVSAFKASVKKP